MVKRRAVTWAGVTTVVAGAGGFAVVAVFGVLGPDAVTSRLQTVAPPDPPAVVGTGDPGRPAVDIAGPGRGVVDRAAGWPRSTARFSAAGDGRWSVRDATTASAPAVPDSATGEPPGSAGTARYLTEQPESGLPDAPSAGPREPRPGTDPPHPPAPAAEGTADQHDETDPDARDTPDRTGQDQPEPERPEPEPRSAGPIDNGHNDNEQNDDRQNDDDRQIDTGRDGQRSEDPGGSPPPAPARPERGATPEGRTGHPPDPAGTGTGGGPAGRHD